MEENKEEIKKNKKFKFISILKKIGFIGFIFFLMKGLFWLIITYAIFKN